MSFRAACVQLRSTTEVAENLDILERLVWEAASRGAHYVQTPEMTHILERRRDSLAAAIGTEQDDPAVARLSALAAELGVVLHIGSLALALPGGKIANRALIFAPDGSVMTRYDKIHLFDVDLPSGESWRESAVYSAGERAVIADLPWCKLGVTICYDIRFPHLYRALAQSGCTVLAAPAAFTRQTGEAHWHVLQRARAIENAAFVISAAQAGLHADGRVTYGHSMIVSPWGEILAEAGDSGPEVIVADINLALATDARRRIPSLANERPFAPPGAESFKLKTVS